MSKAPGAEKKEAQAHPQPQQAAVAEKKGKGPTALPGGCHSWGCKRPEARFNFCAEHYDHFKFGLIKKTGEPVSDYEKKFEQYLAHTTKRGAHKVA